MAAGQGMMLTEDHGDGHLMMMIAGILFMSSSFLLFSTMDDDFPLFFSFFLYTVAMFPAQLLSSHQTLDTCFYCTLACKKVVVN